VNEAVSDITSDMVDLTEVDLSQLQATLAEHRRGDSALAHSLRRVWQDAQHSDSAIAGFQSTL
jgi:FXSXX-COOH protein